MTPEIDHPKHYTFGSIEVIDVLEDWKLGFRLANAVKYIARCDHKGTPIEDLRKAAWYLAREIEKRTEGEQAFALEDFEELNLGVPADQDVFVNRVRSRVPLEVLETADVLGIELPDGRVYIHKWRKGVAGETLTHLEWCERFAKSELKIVLIPIAGDPKERDKVRRKRVIDPRSALLANRIVTFLHRNEESKFHVSELMKELALKKSEHKKLCHYLSRLNRQGAIHRFSRGIYGALK